MNLFRFFVLYLSDKQKTINATAEGLSNCWLEYYTPKVKYSGLFSWVMSEISYIFVGFMPIQQSKGVTSGLGVIYLISQDRRAVWCQVRLGQNRYDGKSQVRLVQVSLGQVRQVGLGQVRLGQNRYDSKSCQKQKSHCYCCC